MINSVPVPLIAPAAYLRCDDTDEAITAVRYECLSHSAEMEIHKRERLRCRHNDETVITFAIALQPHYVKDFCISSSADCSGNTVSHVADGTRPYA